MATGRKLGSNDTEQKLASHSDSDAYSSQQSDMDEEKQRDAEEIGATDWDQWWGFELGHPKEQNWQDISVWKVELCVCLAVLEIITQNCHF
jgi:hypothetical protein